MQPFTPEQIEKARSAPFSAVLHELGAYCKRDLDYVPRNISSGSVRIQVNCKGRDFRFILTGEKWVNELLPLSYPNRGGGGSVDFVIHISGLHFVQAVKVCLNAVESREAI